jgi:hypothetical protein
MNASPCFSIRSCRRLTIAGLIFLLMLASCDDAYPDVVVVNNTDERILIRDISFNGCLWNVVLSHGQSTAPQRCPPGSDRVHFKKLDSPTRSAPLWFSYQSSASHEVDYGDFKKIEIRLDDMEQDFSVPGPYGH